jgi:hypothetical protein
VAIATPAAHQKRRPVKTITAEHHAERQAVIKACSALAERLKGILQTPPQEQSAKVALWRLGLEQAIAAIEEYRGEVRDLAIGRRDVSRARAIQPIGENCVVAAVRFEMCLACLSARPTLHGKLHEDLFAGVGLKHNL